MTSPDRYFYRDHPATCAPDDYWGQVKRTVNGQPVAPGQIDMIVASVAGGLALKAEDVLLDLGCGNGALTDRVFDHCAGGLGVDFSDFLIGVAQRDFQRPPQRLYQAGELLDFLATAPYPQRFDKAMCYGVFMFLDADEALACLTRLRTRFTGLSRVFLGNLPDKARMGDFFRHGEYRPGLESDPASPIGVWRHEVELAELARVAGWNAEVRRMPADFYAAAYRYDAILTPMDA
ncbi:MAG: class I SAM-dependent methyltransferase [Thiobacillus sp.]|nr:class I SAM-dependent methyltransferase [Thiobacillus sp.]